MWAFFLLGYLTGGIGPSGGNSFPKPLSADEEQRYLTEFLRGSEDAKNVLVERNLRLVAHVVKKYGNHSGENEDLISIGTIGLIKAISSYKPEKGTRLATYAARCIENAIYFYVAHAARFLCLTHYWGIKSYWRYTADG